MLDPVCPVLYRFLAVRQELGSLPAYDLSCSLVAPHELWSANKVGFRKGVAFVLLKTYASDLAQKLLFDSLEYVLSTDEEQLLDESKRQQVHHRGMLPSQDCRKFCNSLRQQRPESTQYYLSPSSMRLRSL